MVRPSSPSLARDEFSGRKLGKYEIACRISTGGMSEIFLASQRGVAGFRRYVVLKRILDGVKGHEEVVRMFVQEAKLAASFSHSNIAQVYDLDLEEDLFLAMEFVPGATLVELVRACLGAGESIPTGFALAVARDTALALHYAHTFTDAAGRSRPVIHRDVAGKNIMVSFEGVTKLLDFGIAKRLDRDSLTRVGTVKGTAGYMSPEQIRGERLDARSDVFSLGIVLHECLTSHRLFFRKTREEELHATLKEEIPPPSLKNPEVSPALDKVVLRALRQDREARYPTARQLARDLEREGGDLLWEQERTASFVQRLYADRREQTRQLLSELLDDPEGSGPKPTFPLFDGEPTQPRAGPPMRAGSSSPALAEDAQQTVLEDDLPFDTRDETSRSIPALLQKLPRLKTPEGIALISLAVGLLAFVLLLLL